MMKTNKLMSLLLAVMMLALMVPGMSADGPVSDLLVTGEVTVTAQFNVNLRSGNSTEYEVVATAKPGELFPTTGKTDSGWYEIILKDGKLAYISDKLVFHKPFDTPVPFGAYPPAPTPRPETPRPDVRIPGVYNLPMHQEFQYQGPEVPVYSGPGEFYARADGGQAVLNNGIIQVYGLENSFVMVGYYLNDDAFRIGYVPAFYLQDVPNLQPLFLSYLEVGVTATAALTDDPLFASGKLLDLQWGSRVSLLAYEVFANTWAYVETYHNGQPVRGFVNRNVLADTRVTPTPTPTQTPEPVPCPDETIHITGDGRLPGNKTFSFSGPAEAVYSGPGTNYHRAAGGKASVGGGRLRVWGTVGDWAMIGYGLSNNLYRIGYVNKSILPGDVCVPKIVFNTRGATIISKAAVTDDPILHPTWLFELPEGTRVTLLAYEGFVGHWAYIETTFEGKPFRGFINKDRLQAD